jgi:hypothetical protein
MFDPVSQEIPGSNLVQQKLTYFVKQTIHVL